MRSQSYNGVFRPQRLDFKYLVFQLRWRQNRETIDTSTPTFSTHAIRRPETYILDSFCSPFRFLGRDAFDEDPEVMSFPMAVAEQQHELCATAQKRVGEEKLAERLEDVDVI